MRKARLAFFGASALLSATVSAQAAGLAMVLTVPEGNIIFEAAALALVAGAAIFFWTRRSKSNRA